MAFRLLYAREIALIEIEDSGPGIAQKEVEQIFEPFARGSAASKSNVGGTGLGLTISKLLTQLMGGELSVSSKPGQGSVFQIRLFLPQVREDNAVQEMQALRQVAYLGPRKKILIVDNEPIDRELISYILEPLGFEVDQASSGIECLNIYQTFKPDLILMDLAMPAMDGWEASYIIRKHHRSDVIIGIVSANAFDKGLENAAGIAEADFILKPVNVAELLDWIGQRLQLTWVMRESVNLASISNAFTDINFREDSFSPILMARQSLVFPTSPYLQDLRELIELGYVRGILKKLDEISVLDEKYGLFVTNMRRLTERFQLDAMMKYLNEKDSDVTCQN